MVIPNYRKIFFDIDVLFLYVSQDLFIY